MGDARTRAVIPCRPPGVEPDGRLRGSGFAERQWLVRRDGQFVQVSELLYRVVELADGTRTLQQIARELTESTHWEVTPADVDLIIDSRLVPLGLITGEDAEDRPPSSPPRSPLLANIRLRALGPQAIDRLARVLQHLYRRPLLLTAMVVIGISQFWFFSQGHPSSAIQHVVATPLSLPLIAGLLMVAGVFHELGHSAALRYGGGRARAMGAGLYLFVPIFYTDVTDSYRLGRQARIRTDLGGLYFHLLVAAAFIAAGAATGNEFLLVAAFLIDLDIARQLIPFMRLDGYWLLADLTGIPDLFAHAAPRLKRLFSKGADGAVPAPLRPGVRRIFGAYIVVALPAISGLLGYVAWHAPSIVNRTATALSTHVALVDYTVAHREWGDTALAVLEMILLALPTVGLIFFFVVLARGLARVASRGEAAPVPAVRAELAGTPEHAQSVGIEPADGGMSLQAAIADHLELKRRHAEEQGAAREVVTA